MFSRSIQDLTDLPPTRTKNSQFSIKQIIACHFLLAILFLILFPVPSFATGGLNCDSAYASQSRLWPANHRFKKIQIRGVSGHGVNVATSCVKQDEPLDSYGDGSTSVDAIGLGRNYTYIRSERQGGGNGRVYHIGFNASDSQGQSCQGVVEVGVPKSRWSQVIDEGPVYDSTQHNTDCSMFVAENQPPEIESEPVVQATVGTDYQYQVVATDRFSGRDETTNGGDDWTEAWGADLIDKLSVQYPTIHFNDASDMNGGKFPPHKSHGSQVVVDAFFPGLPAKKDANGIRRADGKSAAAAQFIVTLLSDPFWARHIKLILTTYTTNNSDAFNSEIKRSTVLDSSGNPIFASQKIIPYAEHKTHMHIHLRN